MLLRLLRSCLELSEINPLVSIVVPVFRDTPQLSELLVTLQPEAAIGSCEVVVANGDVTDDSIRYLHDIYPFVRWVTSESGRGQQMNAGAAAASGRWLLFLHADVRLDQRWRMILEEADTMSAVVGGAFALSITSSHWAARFIEKGVAARVRWFRLPYGDQAVFVRRKIFQQLGGYAPLPLMEDVELVRRLSVIGNLWFPAMPVHVSARRWEQDGWGCRTVLNLCLAVLYFLGVSPRRLASWYYGAREEVVGPCSETPHNIAGNEPVVVIMPALNEEEAIGGVIAEIPAGIHEVIVVDNASTDGTVERARAAGATVVTEANRGYGNACLRGLRRATSMGDAIVVFLDADRSDFPIEMMALVEPIRQGTADFVLGDRGGSDRPWHARVGTELCVGLINKLWRTEYRDLGPFRAIRRSAIDRLKMVDRTWGWTIEMQIKAAEVGLVICEVPVRQRARIGQSKISGTVTGTVKAGLRMLYTIWCLWRTRRARVF